MSREASFKEKVRSDQGICQLYNEFIVLPLTFMHMFVS